MSKKVDKEGFLKKQSAKKWFVLSGGDLSYYKKKGDSKAEKVINIVDCEVQSIMDGSGKPGSEFFIIPLDG